jgi:protein involved in temperature-dependent protein secretion
MSERDRRRRVVDYLRSGRAEDAADELAGSREPYPGDGLLHHAIGLAFASRGTLQRAREELEVAAEMQPPSANILADLAQVRLAQGDAGQAVEAAERALEADPNLPLARFTLGRACFVAECAQQARRHQQPQPGQHFPLIDGRTPAYLRAVQEMEAALEAAPPFAGAVRAALAFAYMRAGHHHAAGEQLRAQLDDLPPGEEADQARDRLSNVEREIVRESYWSIEESALSAIQEAAESADASPEAKLRLAHAYAVLGRDDGLASALAAAHAAGYEPRSAYIARAAGENRLYREASDSHLLIAGGLECIIGDSLRFLPFASLQTVVLGQPGPWRTAEVTFASGDTVEAVVPTLYRLSLRSPSDLIQSGRFTQFSYAPGETRYAHAIGVRNLATDDGVVSFAEVESMEFR